MPGAVAGAGPAAVQPVQRRHLGGGEFPGGAQPLGQFGGIQRPGVGRRGRGTLGRVVVGG